MNTEPNHNIVLSYLFWFFGFTGLQRFFYSKRWTGLLYLCTFGVFGIGWIIDAFFIPSWSANSNRDFVSGSTSYNLGWVFLIFLGYLGVHRFYMGKIGTGIIYLLTGGLLGFGILYDIWTLNDQIGIINAVGKQKG
jgi:TM2 domain-containing membrane protein YozV